MATLKLYPHYEINVRDNSIYNVTYEEVLPVHRALWVMRTEKGPPGVPVFCDTAKLRKVFGSQTLNETSEYFSQQAFFLKNTLTYNGAFIVRAIDSTANNAAIILEAVVKTAEVQQYVVDVDPNSDTYGKRLVELDTTSAEYGEYIKKTTETTNTVTTQVPYLIDGEYVKLVEDAAAHAPGAVGYANTFMVLIADGSSNAPGSVDYDETWGKSTVLPSSVAGALLVYQTSITLPGIGADWAAYTTENVASVVTTTPITEPGVSITWRTRKPTSEEIDDGLDQLTMQTNAGTTIYPVLALEALYPGKYGNDLAFRFFYNTRANNASLVSALGSVFNSFSATTRDINTGTSEVVRDRFDRNVNVIAANPECVDITTAVKYDMSSVMNNAYPDDNYQLPYSIYTFESSLAAIGKRVLDVETATSLCASAIAGDTTGIAEAYLATVGGSLLSGYQVNVLTGVNIDGVPYDHVAVKGRTAGDSLVGTEETEEILLDANIDLFLADGTDGNSIDDTFVDQAMYRFCKLYMNPKIVDKARYPITHIIDPGYSMTTKFAMIDFINVRDDTVIDLSTQVLFSNEWATGRALPITVNDAATDIMNGMILRERALLMRESVKHNTDCCRINIFAHTGYPVAATYDKPCPFTLWSAVQRARYGNTTSMSIQEPRGWPYSYNQLFKAGSWNWIMYEENMKDLTWSAGINYCQYADHARIFYPALRTIYRHDTSALVDQWAVDAIVYTKHVCRKVWGYFSGRNDKLAVKQAAVKTYIEAELSALYNGKYDFSVDVYQTVEGKNTGVQSVRIKITFPETGRVFDFDIEVNREGYNPEEAAQ